MINIEKALSICTDKINKNEKIDLNYFRKNMSDKDYLELIDLLKYVKIGINNENIKKDTKRG